ncbi:LysM peptidoglycan-binding domain-containing protein [Agromyces bracchium]|uniref:LysM peptidoglycan-binding domain-containing protein n=1 Tax=Agromyces bracchium TaxID=88376 RepID=A0A6I3M4X5_9MICO|nr:LysM domain-containing protein [Agromyces bracchium]MTH67951.1 LysM peptidoglycan-binding domain-containing protein [Agromyces bracchium]
MRHRRPARPATLLAAGLFSLCGVLMLLAGCAPPETVEAAPATVTATVTTTATATVTVTAAPPTAEPGAAPAPDPQPNAPAPVYEWGPAIDAGPIPGATGTPELDANGEPERYVIVAGDSFFDVAQRFNLPQQQLLRMNPQVHDFGETVYIGDVINLDWEKVGVD